MKEPVIGSTHPYERKPFDEGDNAQRSRGEIEDEKVFLMQQIENSKKSIKELEIPDMTTSEFYSSGEKKKLLEAIPRIYELSGREWGPRSIRVFLSKYQLARELLRLLDRNPEAGQLIEKLVEVMKEMDQNEGVLEQNKNKTMDLLESVVRQVA